MSKLKALLLATALAGALATPSAAQAQWWGGYPGYGGWGGYPGYGGWGGGPGGGGPWGGGPWGWGGYPGYG